MIQNSSESRKILIIDDDTQTLSVLYELLQPRKYKVRLCADPEQGLKIIPSFIPDLIILDIRMPKINGFTIYETIHTKTFAPHIPIIFYTSSENLKDKLKAFHIGAFDYITKSTNAEEVLSRIDRYFLVLNEKQTLMDEVMHKEQTINQLRCELERKEITLVEVLNQISKEQEREKEKIKTSLSQCTIPVLTKIKAMMPLKATPYLNLLEDSIINCASAYGVNITENENSLSAKEIEVCNLIRHGISTKRIAKIMNVAMSTINTHRKKIRRKLGIDNKTVNLTTFLRNYNTNDEQIFPMP